MDDLVAILLFAVATLAAWLVIPNFFTKRAMKKVVRTFEEMNALSAKTAKSPEELGLMPDSFLQSMYRARNYKPNALRVLIKHNIVMETKDGRVYIPKQKLDLVK